MFDVILSPEARAFFKAADKPLALKLARCFTQLEQEPRRHNNIKRLSGKLKGNLRYRVGDWRVLYQIDDKARAVLVLSIANRREIYD
jgi:mRNA interferase RelE/StbE